LEEVKVEALKWKILVETKNIKMEEIVEKSNVFELE
jgi:hypothetical protein